MAVPQEPSFNENENDPQTTTAKNSSPSKQIKPISTPNSQDDGYNLSVVVTTLDKSRREPTNLPKYKQTTYSSVERSYIELERLYNSLSYSNPECIVPALPHPTTSYQATEEDERRVKSAMQLWFNRISSNPVLRNDKELRSFIETDFAFVPSTKPRRRTGPFRFGFSSDIRDDDMKLAEAKSLANIFENHFFDNAKSVQKLARYRKGLSIYNSDLGSKFAAMGTVEKHPPLAHGLRRLGKTLQVVGELQQLQAVSEAAALGDFFSYYAMNSHAAKETLSNRLKIISEHDDAVKTTISKRRYIERLKSSTSIKQENAKNYEQNLDARVKRVTKKLHSELEIYENNRAQDFMAAIQEYIKKQILFEKQQLKEWEKLKPDVDLITNKNMVVHIYEKEELDPRAIAERLSTFG
ncbi:12944_t:CDS:2 [Entrophospora sp. SA101]|nr:12944_t:CDS:2 [Entrophospora sp. SA101]CAJ0907519.1 8756_t:CDS:2 [Entrophospora sp. SA101]